MYRFFCCYSDFVDGMAIVEGTPSAWFSVLLALCDFLLVFLEYMREEKCDEESVGYGR